MPILQILLIALCAIFSSILFNSLLEWIIHGPLEHGKIGILIGQRKSHVDHHHHYSQKEGFSNTKYGNSVAIPHWFFVPVSLISFLVSWPVGQFFHSWLFTIVFVVTSMIHYIFFQYIHTSMHIPKGRWIEGTKWFKKKKAQHIVHHVMDEDFEKPVNICVVCDWADKILQTEFKPKKR